MLCSSPAKARGRKAGMMTLIKGIFLKLVQDLRNKISIRGERVAEPVNLLASPLKEELDGNA